MAPQQDGMKRVGLKAVFETADFQRGITIYNQGVVQVNNNAKQTERQSQQSSKAMATAWEKGFMSVAKKAAAAVAAFITVQKAARYVEEATLLAARVETLGVSLEVVGRTAGYTQEQLAKLEEKIKENGITTQATRQIMLSAAQAQIDLAQTVELTRIAQDSAVIANIDSSEAAQDLIYVIQTGNVRMARTLGLQLSFQRGYEQLAKQLGKTTDELTEQEQVQARVNEVMRAGALIAGTYTAAMGTAGKLMLSLNRLFEEAQLVIGQVNLGAFASGVDEVTRLIKELLRWMEENEEELEDLGVSVTMLADSLIRLADMDLPVESLTKFVENLNTLVSVLSVGIETVGQFRKEHEELLTVLDTINKYTARLPLTLVGMGLDELTKLRKANEDAFKTEQQLAKERRAEIEETAKEERDRRAEAEAALARALAAKEEELAKEKQIREDAAEALQDSFDRIQKMQADHLRVLLREEEDAARERARAWATYDKQVQKELQQNQKRLAELTERHEEQQAKLVRDAEKKILKAEEDAQKDRLKQQADFARQERQQRERYNLDRIQSERRYQYEWTRALAEGDALALYYMQEQYALEQQEAAENEQLRRGQAEENQAEQIRESGEAAREQIRLLREELAEQLAEQEENYQKEIEKQEEANQEQLMEMAANFAEQQRLRDEDREIAAQRREEDYRRQMRELGASLADQEELQKLGAEQVAELLGQYWSEDGLNEEVMRGWHEREQTRIQITEEALLTLAATAGTVAAEVEEAIAKAEAALEIRVAGVTGYGGVTMDEGGVVRGPATVQVGAGMVEAFVPLLKGSMDVTGNIGVGVTGLERASPALANQIASQMGTKLLSDLASEIRERRRS